MKTIASICLIFSVNMLVFSMEKSMNHVNILLSALSIYNQAEKSKDSAILYSFERKGDNLFLQLQVPFHSRDIDGKTPLHRAIENNDNEIISLLVKMGAALNECDKQKKTPLHTAIEMDNNVAIELFALNGAPLGSQDEKGMTPLHIAVERKNVLCTKLLLSLNAPINVRDSRDFSPLAIAVVKSFEITKLLLGKSPIKTELYGEELNTLIHKAVTADLDTHEILKIISLFIKDIDINKHNKHGYTPLMLAVLKKYQLVEGLIALGAAPNIKKPGTKLAALHLAAAEQPLAIRPLVSGGADLELQDYKGATPLFHALNNNESHKILLELGANKANAKIRNLDVKDTLHSFVRNATSPSDILKLKAILEELAIGAIEAFSIDPVDLKGKEDRTPLHEAAQHNSNPSVVNLLLAHLAGVDARDFYGATPLHYAALSNKKEVISALLEAGAKVTAKDRRGATPLHYAAIGNVAGIDLLMEAGADIDATTNDGLTPLAIAMQCKSETAFALIQRGGKVKKVSRTLVKSTSKIGEFS